MENFTLCLTILFALVSYNLCKKSNITPQKDVVVVGGGIAGMAAARRLLQSGRYNVQVFEARKDRYGGRIWTNRKAAKNIRGVDVELGAMFLNTRAENNTLHDLVNRFELQTNNSGSIQLFLPDRNETFSSEKAVSLYGEVFQIVMNAVHNVKATKVDKPVLRAVVEELEKTETDTDQDILRDLIDTLPTLLCHNFSTLLYDVKNEVGWDSIVVDGTDAFLDRIVSGDGTELPVKVQLNKVVRNIEVSKKKNKVLVRTVDKKQTAADFVIVALPVGVLKKKDVIFEPPLPASWYWAMHDIGIGFSNKIIIGFDEVFWPKDVGSFTISSSLATGGFLQMWTNLYRLSGNPFLAGNIFGDVAPLVEAMSEKDLKEKALAILSQMFGKETVKQHKVKTFLRSKWSKDPLVKGSVSYPKVGNTEALWNILRQPVCPHIYFAGAYTETQGHVDSLHGAYNSGVRAAEQIIANMCEKDKKAPTNKQKKKPTNKNGNKISKQKKDEL